MSTITDRIKKLLALAEGTHSQEEAQSALAKAQELLLSNGLSMADIADQAARRNVIEMKTGNYGKRGVPNYYTSIALVMAQNFRVELIKGHSWEGTTLVLIGLEEDVEVCKMALDFSVKFFEKSWKKLKADLPPWASNTQREVAKNTYLSGFCSGLTSRLRENVEEKGLVIVQPPEVKDHIKTKYKKMRESTLKQRVNPYDARTYAMGFEAGRSVQLRKGTQQLPTT